jgi:Ras-related protein Rab-28
MNISRVLQLIILGDGAVGKTSVGMRLQADQFSRVYKQTIGVDFFTKHISLPGLSSCKLSVWIARVTGSFAQGKSLWHYSFGISEDSLSAAT